MTLRAQCLSCRYFPNPLGIVTAVGRTAPQGGLSCRVAAIHLLFARKKSRCVCSGFFYKVLFLKVNTAPTIVEAVLLRSLLRCPVCNKSFHCICHRQHKMIYSHSMVPVGFGGMSGNSNGSIKVSGGNLYINASGDGMDANGTLEISGGYTVVVGPTQGDTATLDYDTSGIISGGTFIGTGASGMAQTFSDSKQGVVAVSVGNQAAGTQILLKDKNSNTVLEHTPELNFAVVILSSPDMVKGESYTITVGTQSAEFEAS